jgi:hypothetical protein
MALPDYTSQDAATYKANIDESVAKSFADYDTAIVGGAATPYTTIEFDSIPSGVRRITVAFAELGTSTASLVYFQAGDATSYAGSAGDYNGLCVDSLGVFSGAAWGSQAILRGTSTTQTVYMSGIMEMVLIDESAHVWSVSGLISSDGGSSHQSILCGSIDGLDSEITRLKFLHSGNFSGGKINLIYGY